LALSPDTSIYISVLKVCVCVCVLLGLGIHKVQRLKPSRTLWPVNWCVVTNVSKDRHTFPFRIKHSALLGFMTLKKLYEPAERWLLYHLTWPNILMAYYLHEPLCHNIKFSIELYFLNLFACVVLYIDRQTCYWG